VCSGLVHFPYTATLMNECNFFRVWAFIHSLETRMATLAGYASFYAFSAVWVGDKCNMLFYSAANHYADV